MKSCAHSKDNFDFNKSLLNNKQIGLPFYNGRPVCLFILNHCLLILNDICPAEQQVALLWLVLGELCGSDDWQPAVDILAGDVGLFAEKFDVKFCLILLLQ